MTEVKQEKKRYWLKLEKNFLDSKYIKIIKNLDNGTEYILFYLALMLESIENIGHLRLSELVPYNEKTLASLTGINVDIVRSALKLFSEFGMIVVLEDGTIFLPDVPAMTGKESESAERVRLYRARKKMLQNNDNVTKCNDNKEKDKQEDKQEEYTKTEKPTDIKQIPSLSSKLITKETSNNNDSPFQTEETNKAIETTKESSKTKETNKKKEKANALPTANESFYKNIESIYFENYKSLFEKGKLQIEVPAYSYAKNRSILSRYKNYDESLLKKVLDNAMDDKWIVDNGYGFNQIFSENVFNRLVNIKSKDDLIPVQNNCAKCGFPLQNNKCLFCG